MLHAFITAIDYLVKKYNIEAKFCISIHDSILYMVKEEQAKQLVAIYQVAHALTWAWLRSKYEIFELPQSNAWLSSVEIDHIFRKSATESTSTVSNNVYEPSGLTLTIHDVIDVANELFA